MPYLIILIATLFISPFVLKLAQSRTKEDKKNLRNLFLFILAVQIGLGLLNWENMTTGRSGFELALTYPNSFLGFFFIISLTQIVLLTLNKSFNTFTTILNFLNSIIIFIVMVRLSNILSFQVLSLASIGAVFLVLTSNIIGLVFINKNRNLLKKYLR